MALFNFIFISLFVLAWMGLGLVPWLVTSVVTRGNAGMAYLPLCLLAGAAGGMLIPFIGFTGTGGIWLSMLSALVLASILMVARQLSRGAHEARLSSSSSREAE